MATKTTTRITGTLETTEGLNAEEIRILTIIARTGYATLEEAHEFLSIVFKGWFIHQGGNHVALHKSSTSERVLLLRA